MNNKRWYILFSILILLIIGYVVYVWAATVVGSLTDAGVNLNVTTANGSGTYGNTGLVNDSKIIASVIGLNLTIFGQNLTTNASWYIANASDNYYILIGNSSIMNQTQFGRFDLAVNFSGDLATRTYSNARTYNILVNITNFSDFGTNGYTASNMITKILVVTLYPHRLNNSNASVMINGFVRSGSINNITNNANVSGIIIFNATLATNTITTNVTWYAINGSRGIILGTNNQIGNTTVEFDTGNGTLSDGFYNITLHVTNRTDFALSGSGVYDPINSFNVSVLNLKIQNVAEIGSLTAAGITLNVTHLGIKGGSINYTGGAGRELPLANNSEILAGVIALNITLSGSNLTTNASWYINNVSDNYYTVIAVSNISNATSYGQYDFATSFNVDLSTRTFSNARTYILLANFTNYSNFGSNGYSVANSVIKTLTLKIYPHRLMNNRNNNTVILDGEYTKRDGTVTGLSSILSTAGYLINVSTQINVTGKVILNASVAAGNITTNVSWYARGDTDGNGVVEEIVMGLNHSIGGTRILWDTNNLSSGLYNITLHVTNLSNGSGISGHVFNPANSFNKSILTVMVDNVAPAVDISLSDSDDIIYTRGENKAKCSFSDSGSGLLPNTQVLELEKPNGEILTVLTGTDASNEYAFNEKETAATGTYIVRCKASDSSNQQTVTEKTFQVFARGGPSSATGGSGKKTVEETEGGEAGAVEQPTGPTGAAVGEGAAPGPSAQPNGNAGSTIAIIVVIIIIAGIGVYFIIKKPIKPGQKKGQLNWRIS